MQFCKRGFYFVANFENSLHSVFFSTLKYADSDNVLTLFRVFHVLWGETPIGILGG